MNRRIILCCGLGTTGKSFWAERLFKHYESDRTHLVDLDEVRIANWGRERQLTDEEHLFKNEILRLEVKKKFLIHQARIVVVNATMLTVERHQRPFVQMAREIGAEIAAVLFTCSFETSKRRIEVRSMEPVLSDVVSVSVFEHGRKQFEPPVLYPFIQIDTSDESALADERRWQEILEFLERE